MNGHPSTATGQTGRSRLRRYAIFWAVSVALVFIVSLVGWIARVDCLTYMLLPGIFLAAVPFPDGINSDWPYTFMGLAAAMNALVYMWPLMWLWNAVRRIRAGNRKEAP
jgi:hypothetical protein